ASQQRRQKQKQQQQQQKQAFRGRLLALIEEAEEDIGGVVEMVEGQMAAADLAKLGPSPLLPPPPPPPPPPSSSSSSSRSPNLGGDGTKPAYSAEHRDEHRLPSGSSVVGVVRAAPPPPPRDDADSGCGGEAGSDGDSDDEDDEEEMTQEELGRQ
ncbi:unnamed protein product, partial [Laminaria digitata]